MLGRRLFYLLLIVCYSSCTSSGHFHDGKYEASTFLYSVRLDIKGGEITVDNSLTGTSKFSIKQFNDRIEYYEKDGNRTVLWVQDDGSLKLNNFVIFKKRSDNEIELNDKEENRRVSKSTIPKNIDTSYVNNLTPEEQEDQAAMGDGLEMKYQDSIYAAESDSL